MKTLEYNIRFITPAFLGNAEQSGQWRTPPFKALLRQWWRVAYAAEKNFHFDMAQMRHNEGLLFGHAWLEDDINDRKQKVAARKSQVRIRLDSSDAQYEQAWAKGTQQGVVPLPNGLDSSYAWFGLIKRGNNLPDRTGIKSTTAEGMRKLRLALPDEHEHHLALFEKALLLINDFGLLGSRSRGGWGALQIDKMDTLDSTSMLPYARDITTCLQHDWAMSLAKDAVGLCIWESNIRFDSWDKAMRFIAGERKKIRTALKSGTDLRPALGFATPTGRMPSPLRWKVIAPQQGQLVIRVFAMPHKIPDEGKKNLSSEKLALAWKTVFNTLDSTSGLQRLK